MMVYTPKLGKGQPRGSVLSVPGLGAGALTPTGLWAPLRASLTPTFFRQSHAHPIPKGRLPAQGIPFSQTRPWRV